MENGGELYALPKTWRAYQCSEHRERERTYIYRYRYMNRRGVKVPLFASRKMGYAKELETYVLVGI